ncbi:MAG: LysM peptidoglycan-binding domain-containing protein [Chitinophagaceae bacterium]
MKKIALYFFLFLVMAQLSVAQKGDLVVKSNDKGLYLDHKVAPKESFFAIGRLYNVSPKYLASYNKLELSKGLQVDQKLRIPLTDTNFTQQGNHGTPVYYKVGEKEGLMTVSNKNNNVLLSSLRSWNNLQADELKKDAKIIIGFLQSSGMPAITIKTKSKGEEPVVKTEDKPLVTEPVLTKEEKKDEEKEGEAEKKAEKKQEKKKPEPVAEVKTNTTPVPSGQGYFKTYFDLQARTTPVTKEETVTAGIFKTTSGWEDAKYYLLMDKVSPGTIVRIINPTNNKAVYAKVLGEMSGIRQNEGLNIRISNAAASALVISEQDKFIVKLNY